MRQSGLDFGYTPYLSTSRAQTLTMTNHTRGKVLVVWQLPTTHGAGGPDAGHSVATQVRPLLPAPTTYPSPHQPHLGRSLCAPSRLTPAAPSVTPSHQAVVKRTGFDPPPPESRAPAFHVDPMETEINPGKSVTFQVSHYPGPYLGPC